MLKWLNQTPPFCIFHETIIALFHAITAYQSAMRLSESNPHCLHVIPGNTTPQKLKNSDLASDQRTYHATLVSLESRFTRYRRNFGIVRPHSRSDFKKITKKFNTNSAHVTSPLVRSRRLQQWPWRKAFRIKNKGTGKIVILPRGSPHSVTRMLVL